MHSEEKTKKKTLLAFQRKTFLFFFIFLGLLCNTQLYKHLK